MKKIKIWAFAKLQALLIGLIGLLNGICYSFGGLIYDLCTIGLNKGTALAFLALLGMPLLFASGGFVLGLIEALLYNALVKRFPSLKITVMD